MGSLKDLHKKYRILTPMKLVKHDNHGWEGLKDLPRTFVLQMGNHSIKGDSVLRASKLFKS